MVLLTFDHEFEVELIPMLHVKHSLPKNRFWGHIAIDFMRPIGS